jgi:hypothetical protein
MQQRKKKKGKKWATIIFKFTLSWHNELYAVLCILLLVLNKLQIHKLIT